jgi:hypothetical protein
MILNWQRQLFRSYNIVIWTYYLIHFVLLK